MLKNLSIRVRLIFVIGLLSSILMVVTGMGLLGQSDSNESLRTVYEDRLVALGQLDTVIRAVNRNQLVVAKSLTDGGENDKAQADQAEKHLAEQKTIWEAYKATYLTDSEKILVARADTLFASFDTQAMRPALEAMRAGDAAAVAKVLNGPMTSIYGELRKPINDLIQLQLDVAKAEYIGAHATFSRFRLIALALLLFGIATGIAMCIWLIRSISTPIEHSVKIAQAVAAGDLTQRIEADSSDETGRLLKALSAMSIGLHSIVTKVRLSTDTIATASSQIAAGNLDLSSRTEEQASSLEETAASMEELTSTVKNNEHNATQANVLALQAADMAEEGGKVVAKVVVTMGSINESSKKIADIISVIDGIAFQTNILALNAAVEAARAGEQGRGFAVVASEVRNLAQRSATAAKEIKALIDDSVRQVGEGVELVGAAGVTMDDVVQSVKRVTDIMSEITAASKEQTSGIEQINQAILQMDQVTQQNASLVEEAAAAAESLQDQARDLAEVVSTFKV